MSRLFCLIVGGGAALLLSPAAGARVVDFEGLANGQESGSGAHGAAAQPYGNLFLLSASSNGAPVQGAAVFDSDPFGPNAGSADRDLLVGLGNILIVQNDSYATQTILGFYDTPNDEERGGTMVFDFRSATELLSLDLIDIDGHGAADVILEDGAGYVRTYNVGESWTHDIFAQGPAGWDTLDFTTLAPQVGEGGGVATAWQDPLFDASDVVRLTVNLSGSAGIDNLVFVPAPSALVALAVGLLGPTRRRRIQPSSLLKKSFGLRAAQIRQLGVAGS